MVNHTEMNLAVCRELLAITWAKKAGALRTVLMSIGGFLVLYAAFSSIQQGAGALGRAVILLLVGILSVFMGGWGYLFRLPFFMQRQRRLWGAKTLTKTVKFFPHNFEQQSSLGRLTFAYKDISHVLAGKSTVVLMVKGTVLQMDKNGFENGSYADFKRFLAEKCPALAVRTKG